MAVGPPPLPTSRRAGDDACNLLVFFSTRPSDSKENCTKYGRILALVATYIQRARIFWKKMVDMKKRDTVDMRRSRRRSQTKPAETTKTNTRSRLKREVDVRKKPAGRQQQSDASQPAPSPEDCDVPKEEQEEPVYEMPPEQQALFQSALAQQGLHPVFLYGLRPLPEGFADGITAMACPTTFPLYAPEGFTNQWPFLPQKTVPGYVFEGAEFYDPAASRESLSPPPSPAKEPSTPWRFFEFLATLGGCWIR